MEGRMKERAPILSLKKFLRSCYTTFQFIPQQTELSNSLIQFSLERQGCVPSLLLDLRPDCGGGNEDNGNLLQKISVPPTLQQDYKES